jgi:FMN phosphatase YigB (HAD superfamily)
MDLAPEEAVFVGDQPVLDVRGARRAGMWMVQIGDLAADGAEPHARINALDELLPALRSLALIE